MTVENDEGIGLSLDLSGVGADLVAVTNEIEAAFRETGEVIAQELKAAARSGEADFSIMARSIAEELASIALERVFTNAPERDQPAPMTVNVALPQSAQAQNSAGRASSANAIASLVAQAVLRGVRFS